jgi:hypothetical protein
MTVSLCMFTAPVYSRTPQEPSVRMQTTSIFSVKQGNSTICSLAALATSEGFRFCKVCNLFFGSYDTPQAGKRSYLMLKWI